MKSAIGKALNTPLSPLFVSRGQLSEYILSAKQAQHDMRNNCAPHSLRIAARNAYAMFCLRINTELKAGARHRY